MTIMTRFFKLKAKGTEISFMDRRFAKRYDVPLKLKYYDPATDFRGEGVTKNISRAGLRFTVAKKIFKGAVLNLVIEDPNSIASIPSKAKVIWLEEVIPGNDVEDIVYEVGVSLLKKRLY